MSDYSLNLPDVWMGEDLEEEDKMSDYSLNLPDVWMGEDLEEEEEQGVFERFIADFQTALGDEEKTDYWEKKYSFCTKPYQCGTCKNLFASGYNLKRHVKRAHPKIKNVKLLKRNHTTLKTKELNK